MHNQDKIILFWTTQYATPNRTHLDKQQQKLHQANLNYIKQR